VSKGPRDSIGSGVQDSEDLLLAETDETIVGVPDVEQAEVQVPAPAVPGEAHDVAAVPVLPDRPGEGGVELLPVLGDLVLVREEELGVLLAEMGLQILGPAPHLLTPDQGLAVLEELREIELGILPEREWDVLEERPAVLRHVMDESVQVNDLEREHARVGLCGHRISL